MQLIRLIKTLPNLLTSLTIMIKLVSEKSAYILFKHHKENLNNCKQARSINPAYTELGLVSKNVIQKIIIKILENSRYNLRKN